MIREVSKIKYVYELLTPRIRGAIMSVPEIERDRIQAVSYTHLVTVNVIIQKLCLKNMATILTEILKIRQILYFALMAQVTMSNGTKFLISFTYLQRTNAGRFPSHSHTLVPKIL